MALRPLLLSIALLLWPQDGWVDPSPHANRFAPVNGITLHYLDWGGSGEPLLLLAGLFSSAHSFDELAPRFTSAFRVLALTRRGHGKSDHPATGYSLGTLVEDIRQFLDELKIDRVHVAGVSAGGVEAALFAARYPERVHRVVYLDSAYDHSAGFRERWAPRLAQNPVKTARLPFPPGSLGMAQEIIASGMAAPPVYSEIKAPALAIFAIPTRPDVPDDADAELRRRAQAFLAEVLAPMQREQIEQLRKSGPSVTIVELTDTTHMRFMAERESDIVRAMMTFLQQSK